MAFFKFRKRGDDQTTPAAPPESVEVLRKRARHRLIGATILVLAGVIGFPLLVDKQPRPVAVDVSIDIPDKTRAKPLLAAPPVQPQASSAPQAVTAPEPKPQAPVADKPAEKTTEKATDKPADKPAEKKPADEGAKAQALLEGKAPPVQEPAAAGGRFVVQVGAFADAAKAHEVRLKVERAGLKTYTQVAQTPEGKRIRVRVGPFAARADAERAVDKIKKLDLPAIVLTL